MIPVIISKRIVVPPGICASRPHRAVSTAAIARPRAALTLAVGRPREALGNYFEVVRRPLDLGTILADLQHGAYAAAADPAPAAADPAPAAANPAATAAASPTYTCRVCGQAEAWHTWFDGWEGPCYDGECERCHRARAEAAAVARLVADVQLVWSNCRCASTYLCLG